MMRSITIIAAISLTALFAVNPGVSSAQSPQSGENHVSQSDSSTTDSDQSESTIDQNISWFTAIGGNLDFSSGMMFRYTTSTKTDFVGQQSSRFLTAGNIDVQAGILDRHVVDFSYERPLRRTRFTTNALAYQENTSHGMEKYTFGVDIGPIFKWIIPGDIPWIVRRILSIRFRTEKELLQTRGTLNENTLFITDETELSDGQMQESDFTSLSSSSGISLKQRYNYYSVDFPIFYFNSREYDFSKDADDTYHVDRLPGDQQSFLWIGTGVSRWNFIDPTLQQVSELGGRDVMFSVHNEVWAANLEATFKSTNMEYQGTEYKFASITRAGYGFKYEVSNPHVDIERIVGLSETTEFGTGSKYFQTTVAFGVNLLSNSDEAKLYITPRATYREIKNETSARNSKEGIFYFKLNIDLMI